jgi:hypothetical protein
LIALCVALAATRPASAGPADAEDELKSATVLSFLRYSTWPVPPAANDPITVGILGRASFAHVLAALLTGKTFNGHALRLVELRPGADPHGCHLLYFATDKKTEISEALRAIGTAPVLTVGESDKFLDYGGIVNLLLVDGHMSFEVSVAALKRSGIDISSKLLRFGHIRGKVGA